MTKNERFLHMQGSYISRLVLFLMIMAMTMIACDLSVDDLSDMNVTVTLSEDTVNQLLQHSFVEQDEDNLFDSISSIDMQPGLIRIFGTYTPTDSASVSGSVDISFSVEDGMLNAEITAVDIAGLDIDSSRVTLINEVMAEAFSAEASGNDNVEFVSVNITEDAFEITIRVIIE